VSFPKLPVNLGEPVRVRTRDGVGIVVGIVFAPPGKMLVRWAEGGPTFEPLEALAVIQPRL
jgi:hypothetical protein